MTSCLYPIFTSIFTSISTDSSSENLNDIVESFGNSSLPFTVSEKHFNIFLESLHLYNTNKKEASQKLYEAFNESINCKLCFTCTKCARSFYVQIVQLLFESYELNGSYNYWKPIIDSHKLESQTNFNAVENYLLRHIEDKTIALEFYQEKYENIKKTKSLNNKFINLKGMSSSTPTIYNSVFNSNYTGGGFFINWYGYGIAIDPGYNFVSNMHKNNITIFDINAVIVTHEHIDHTCDIRTIDDLNYQINSLRKIDSPHIIDWYWDSETNKIYNSCLNSEYSVVHIVDELTDNFWEYSPITIHPNILLSPVKTRHIMLSEKIYASHTFGFILNLNSPHGTIRIGYTSDTTFFPALCEAFNKINLLIANISSINAKDLLRESQKNNHLGFMGCMSLLEQISNRPDYFIISEFWCGKDDIRFDISKYISQQLLAFDKTNNTTILPAEVGLTIDLANLATQCSSCLNYSKKIHVTNPSCDFGEIKYLCPTCIYS